MTKTTKASPKTRKPAPAKARRKIIETRPEIVRRKLVWRGVLVGIQYQPWAFDRFGHLELTVIAPKGAPLPGFGAGFYADYVYRRQVKETGGTVAFVGKWLDQEARSPGYQRTFDRWKQPDLFEGPEA